MVFEPAMYLFLAGMLLMLPLEWLLSAVLAAVIHELFHAAAVWLLRGSVSRVSVGMNGARMEVRLPGSGAEMLAALAGPLGSFLLLFLCGQMPKLAVCGFVQGCYNLLPVWPLDGGRALRCALELLFPSRGDRLFFLVEKAALMLILAALLWCAAVKILDMWLLAAAMISAFAGLGRKIPCKPGKIRVQ